MILRIYNFLKTHSILRRCSLLVLTLALAALLMRLTYKEDISDFLPLGTHDREMYDIYRDISGAGKLVVVFESNGSADSTIEAVDMFCQTVQRLDTIGWTESMTAQIDMDKVSELQDFVYSNIPYFLTTDDYQRMDSMLAQHDFVAKQLEQDRQLLLFPSGSMMTDNISRDPLRLFQPVMQRLQAMQQGNNMEIVDGYVFTPDMSRAIVTLDSPFGNAETDRNAQLLSLLDAAIDTMQAHHPAIKAHVSGGPQIAVGNARQIKHDSILAVALAAVLILVLLLWSLRSVKSILLIVISIAWGWLFAMGGMALFGNSVSVIVIGISSVILGIAVNYPLHLVVHTMHEPDIRHTLRDIASPLLVGNVTTVGAFLALVPLQSTALRDLGLFASLLLVGTIAFVLTYLPHAIAREGNSKPSSMLHDNRILTRIASIRLENKRWLVAVVSVLTVVFGWFSLQTEFDANMANINYMTEEQRADMEYFSRMAAADTTKARHTLYVVSSGKSIDAALDTLLSRNMDMTSHFLTSRREQARRLQQWKEFMMRNKSLFERELSKEAVNHGFAADAFEKFTSMSSREYTPKPFSFFSPLTETVFAGNISIDSTAARYSFVDKLNVTEAELPMLRGRYTSSFDTRSMNSAMASMLTDNFNYIGLVCSAIVFLFLWLSFRSLWVAIVAFVPMAVSWIWILGIMAIAGIKFNIVNIILATFIFGQGDDYTIFITEGCLSERRGGCEVLTSYKQSILLSAAIMFIGIGTLITARHPALFSLAEITIIGMACVVFMSWMLPPLLFNIANKFSNNERKNTHNS